MISKPIFITNYRIYKDTSLLGNQTFYTLACEDKERYLRITESKIKYVEMIIPLLNGENTLQIISEKIQSLIGKKVDVIGLYVILIENGFIESENDNIPKSELDIMSKELIRIKFPKVKEYIFERFNNIKKIILTIYFIILVSDIAVILTQADFEIFKKLHLGKYLNLDSETAIFLLISSYISLFLHEISHIVVALSYRKSINKISFNLYAGCIPMIYVKVRGINTLPVRKRFGVVVAGIATNFVIGITAFALSSIWDYKYKEVLIIIGIVNIYGVLLNLLPFSLSDGYFILTMLCNRYDIRTYLIKNMFSKKLWSKLNKKEFILYLIYFLISTFIIGRMMIGIIKSGIGLVIDGKMVIGIIIFAIIAVTLVHIIKNIILLYRNSERLKYER